MGYNVGHGWVPYGLTLLFSFKMRKTWAFWADHYMGMIYGTHVGPTWTAIVLIEMKNKPIIADKKVCNHI